MGKKGRQFLQTASLSRRGRDNPVSHNDLELSRICNICRAWGAYQADPNKGFSLKKKKKDLLCLYVCVPIRVCTRTHPHTYMQVSGSQGMSDPLEMELQLDVGAQN